MRQSIRLAVGGLAAVAAVAVFARCSDSTGGSSSGGATVITSASVQTGIAEVAPLIPICAASAAIRAEEANNPTGREPAWLANIQELKLAKMMKEVSDVQALTGAQPPDVFGTCGGRLTYPDYSHLSGVTTGTFAFEDYCTVDSETGERSIANGRISFVNTGVPSPTGPITQKIEASSTNGVTFITRNSAGQQLTSQKFTFTNYLFTPGTPGSEPTAAKPDELKVAELKATNNVTGKTYRQTSHVMRVFETASGGQQATLSGRSHRSNGEYFDITTPTPLVSDASGNTVAGALRFGGANGSNAVMTLVPGTTLQATMTVNGTPVTNVPPCR